MKMVEQYLDRKKREYIPFIIAIILERLITGNIIVLYEGHVFREMQNTDAQSYFIIPVIIYIIALIVIRAFLIYTAIKSISMYDISRWSNKYKNIFILSCVIGGIYSAICYFILRKRASKKDVV
jgi:hypothetical protein